MSVKSPRIRSLLRQADSVAAAGKRAAAEQLYRQIVEEAPETAQAWYGLAQVVSDAEERETALSRAHELDPDHDLAGDRRSDSEEELPDEAGETSQVDRQATISKDGKARNEASREAVAPGVAGAPQRDESAHIHEVGDSRGEDPAEATQVMYCVNHPGRETHLRCNRCGKPICSKCANPTPVGYRCPECIREQEDVYFTATPLDYLVTALVALPLSLAIGWLATLILSSPFGFFLIFLGAFSGSLVGRIAFRAARRRRGRWMPHLIVVCVLVGGILPALGFLVAAFFGQFSLRLLFLGIYLVTAAGAAFYQMR